MLDAFVVVSYERIPVAMILCVLAGEIVIAEQAALKTFGWSAFPVFARCAATVEAHGALCTGKPFQAFPEFFELE